MFEFFEGLIEKLGVKLISNFSDKLYDFIKEIKNDGKGENNDNGGYYAQIGSSGDSAQIGSSGYYAQIGSSGDSAQIGSSGDSAQIGSSGDSAQIGSSGYYAKIGSSGYSAQIGSSGNSAQIGSSGNSAQIGSSGNYAQIGSSGYYAQIGSSGYYAKIGSSGYYAQIGSSGDSAQIGSSGDSAQIGSSGDSAQIGSSGNSAQIGSSGYYAKIGSSGYSAQIGSSGNSAQIGSSGNYAKIDISGNKSVGFACGYSTKIRAKKGTWISLAEYGRNENNEIIPIYAKSAQIGNKEFTDNKGKMLKSTAYYTLWKKEFYEVEEYDEIETIKISEKKRENITIIKAIDMDTILNEDIRTIYIAKEGKLSAHGYTVREAVEDLTLKKMDNVNIDELIKKIKDTGKVTRSQYRAITGACSYGTNKFCEEHNIADKEEIELDELRKILINDYGSEKFWNLIDRKD